MSKTIRVNYRNNIDSDLTRFNHRVNKKWTRRMREKLQKLDAKSQWRTGEFRSSRELIGLDVPLQ